MIILAYTVAPVLVHLITDTTQVKVIATNTAMITNLCTEIAAPSVVVCLSFVIVLFIIFLFSEMFTYTDRYKVFAFI